MKYILIVSIVLVLIFAPLFTILLLNQCVFSHLFDMLHLQQYNGFEKREYLNKVSSIIRYFFDRSVYLTIDGFTEIEKIHMKDVKILVLISFLLFLLSLFFIVYFRKNLKRDVLKISAVTTIIFVISLIGFSLTNFDEAFTLFHRILFRNNYWLLDPDTLLIRLFPEEVFMKLAYVWFGGTLLLSLAILLYLYVSRRKRYGYEYFRN